MCLIGSIFIYWWACANFGRSCAFPFWVVRWLCSAKEAVSPPSGWYGVSWLPPFVTTLAFLLLVRVAQPTGQAAAAVQAALFHADSIDLLKILSAPPDHWLDGPSAVLGENHLMSAPAASGSSATIRRRSVPHVNIQTKTTCEWKSHTTWTSVNKNILFPSTVVEYRISTKFNKRNDLFIQIEHRN